MFDKKIEPIAQRYVRAQLALKEAQELADLAKEALQGVLPEGTNYTTKDGDVVTHVRASQRKSWIVAALQKRLPARIWKAIRVDAIDTKKLGGFIEAGEVDPDQYTDCFDIIPVKASVRVTWAASKPMTNVPKATRKVA